MNLMEMERKKTYQIGGLVIFCILINYGGKAFAVSNNLPLWLDSIGTVLSAYLLGPVCGVIVGVTNNILYGLQDPTAYIYLYTSVSIGILVGIFAKHKFFDSIFLTTSLSVLITMISVIISTILNVIFYDGMTGNIWGDGVIGYMLEHGYHPVLSYVAGEFYIDFVDKLLSLWFLYVMIRLIRYFKKKKIKFCKKGRVMNKAIAGILLLSMIVPMLHTSSVVFADENQEGGHSDISYTQTVYNAENGLPCGEANAITQTNDGILWIGTYAGLYRYNGSEMKLMDDYESVRNVNCLYVDEEGRLWIGTNDSGVVISINESVSNVIDEDKGLPSNSVRCIVQGSDGYYYIGTTDSMQILSLNGGLSLIREVEEINYAISVDSDDSGYVAAVNTKGELFLLKNQEIVIRKELDSAKEQYTSCIFDEKGLLYAATSTNHIEVYEVSEGTLIQKTILDCPELSNINYLYIDEDKVLYVCADNGIGYFDENNQYRKINTNEFNNSIDCMTIDYQGNKWFTSSRMGVLRLCESNFVDLYSVAGMESKVVNTIEEWDSYLYIGTDTGLDIIDRRNNVSVENELTEQLNGVRIRCIKADSKNHLWICTYGSGLWEIEGENIKVYNSENNTFCDRVRVVLEMSDKTIVAAGDSGIIFIRDGQVTDSIVYGEGLSNTMVLSLTELEDGTLLAGTDGDGITVIKNGEVISKITREDGLGSEVILRIVKDSQGDGAFVVTSNGLCYLGSDYTVTRLNNFPYFNNYDIWESPEGRLFVLGSAGIYVVDRENLLSGEEVRYELLDMKSGLSSALTVNSWNYCDDSGFLYLSCHCGVFGIDMNQYEQKAKSYRMMVSSVKIDDVMYDVEWGVPISIPRDTSKIEIFPDVINYSTETPFVCYYLEGVDKTETIIPQSELTSIVYTNLASGTYQFHLAVLDRSKMEILEESVYILEKDKEIYDNWWFGIYMLVVLILAVAWLTWFVVRTQIQRTIKLQRRELELAKKKIEMGNETILAIAKTVDAKDENTSQHSQRVSEYSVMIARELGMNEEECENLRKIALLHDIGKIGIADKVLNKPDRLNDEEYEIMKSHVVKGAEILKDFTLIDNVWEGALYHHERYDGKGYVSGLKGEEIPINARIIGIADAFDAMTANRVYRRKLELSVVLEELKKGRGTQFDPKCVDILIRLIEEGKINVSELYQEEKPDKEV